MRDQDDRRAAFAIQFAQQFDDLRLHGDVERGGRFVGDQDFGLGEQRHRDHHALAHAAGKLVRIHADAARGIGNAHRFERFDRAAARFAARHLAMQLQRLDHLPFDRQERIERGHRVLKDHADAVAANPVQRRFVHASAGSRRDRVAAPDTLPLPARRPSNAITVWLLPEPDSPTMPSVLACFERKRHALHRVDGCAFAAREAHAEVFDFE